MKKIISTLILASILILSIIVLVQPGIVSAATIILSPASGPVGTVVTVTGVGFPVNATGTLAAPAGVITLPHPVTTTAAGTFSTTVTILPDAPVGPAIFTATVGGVTATAIFMMGILPAPEIPLLVGLERIINVLFGVLIVVAVIYVIIGAWSLMTAAGDATKIEAGRTKILYALIAVVVALLARGLIEFIRRVIAP